MLIKTTTVLAAAIMLGLGSMASAGDSGEYHGGFKVGPMGQTMGTPSEWGVRAAPLYGYVPPATRHPTRKHVR